MSWLARALRRPEARNSIEQPGVPVSAERFLEYFGQGAGIGGAPVTIDAALGVPAVWAAVNFISRTIASLPLHVYERGEDSRERAGGPLYAILHDAPNEETSSFAWRKRLMEGFLTAGRGVSFIERAPNGDVINLWALDPERVSVQEIGSRRFYHYADGSRTLVYEARDVIDLPFMLARNGLGARSPIFANRRVIGQAIAATEYGARFFENGGVPPFVMTGKFASGAGLRRASDDLGEAVRSASGEKRLAIVLPDGHEIKPLGVDPEKSQLVELQRYLVEQIARVYSLPPVFLQDLTHGTYSNTEQQDLHLVKHTIKHLVEQFEAELNLKLFRRGDRRLYCEFDLDGVLRGDFKTRMEGYATAIQNGILKPNEARGRENHPADPDGNRLMIQGATVPLGQQPRAEEDGA